MSDLSSASQYDRYAGVTEEITRIPLRYPAKFGWWILFGFGLLLLLLFVISATVLFTYGVGVWGNNIPVN